MLAYKFTRPDGQGAFTGFRWPLPQAGEPGDWVRAQAAEVCVAGIHACRAEQLPHWLGPELWVGLDAHADAAATAAGSADLLALADRMRVDAAPLVATLGVLHLVQVGLTPRSGRRRLLARRHPSPPSDDIGTIRFRARRVSGRD